MAARRLSTRCSAIRIALPISDMYERQSEVSIEAAISEIGHKRTFRDSRQMSALPPKANIRSRNCCRSCLELCHAPADGFDAGDEARQRVRCHAARQHHLNQRKLAPSLYRAIERGSELPARGDPFAHAADQGRDIGKMPVIEIVEVRFGLKHPQHLPALVVEQYDDRIEAVAAAIAELPAGHLEGAVAHQ